MNRPRLIFWCWNGTKLLHQTHVVDDALSLNDLAALDLEKGAAIPMNFFACGRHQSHWPVKIAFMRCSCFKVYGDFIAFCDDALDFMMDIREHPMIVLNEFLQAASTGLTPRRAVNHDVVGRKKFVHSVQIAFIPDFIVKAAHKCFVVFFLRHTLTTAKSHLATRFDKT